MMSGHSFFHLPKVQSPLLTQFHCVPLLLWIANATDSTTVDNWSWSWSSEQVLERSHQHQGLRNTQGCKKTLVPLKSFINKVLAISQDTAEYSLHFIFHASSLASSTIPPKSPLAYVITSWTEAPNAHLWKPTLPRMSLKASRGTRYLSQQSSKEKICIQRDFLGKVCGRIHFRLYFPEAYKQVSLHFLSSKLFANHLMSELNIDACFGLVSEPWVELYLTETL